MGIIDIVKSVVTLPFKIILFPLKLFKRKDQDTSYPDQPQSPVQSRYPSSAGQTNYPSNNPDAGNAMAKFDLISAQMDSLKLEYETLNQRIQNIERMVREIYSMAKS